MRAGSAAVIASVNAVAVIGVHFDAPTRCGQFVANLLEQRLIGIAAHVDHQLIAGPEDHRTIFGDPADKAERPAPITDII
jgi:hypothetical protein